MKLKVLLLAVLTAAAVHAADSIPLFNAVLNMGKEQRFVLADAAGTASGWLKLGDAYSGYTLKAYDAAATTLDLERDGKTTKITLINGAGVKNAPMPAAATMADAQELFRVMRFEEMMAKILDQQKKALGSAMQQQMNQRMAQLKIAEEDKPAFMAMQQKMFDESMNAAFGPEMMNDMAKIYSEVFTKDEMGSMAAFYSTPGGQALIDKQPAVQQKMMAVMMPRMMQSQAKVQQTMRDFTAELAAKHAAAGTAAQPADAPAPAKP